MTIGAQTGGLRLSGAERFLRVVFCIGLVSSFVLWPLLRSILPLVVFCLGFLVLVLLVLPHPGVKPETVFPVFLRPLPYMRLAPAWCFMLVLGAAIAFVPDAALAPWQVTVPLGIVLAVGMYWLLGRWMRREPEER